MPGYCSKKLMSEIRWIGPYAPKDRHADDITINHVIDLRKRLETAVTHRENSLNGFIAVNKKYIKAYNALVDIIARSNDDDSWMARLADIRKLAQEGLKDGHSGQT
jgi:hypothetical protein